jgi:hypothetical protein
MQGAQRQQDFSTEIGVATGRMRMENAAALVGAAMLSLKG